jgi:4'-phosphopantetheinyl transferase EntD
VLTEDVVFPWGRCALVRLPEDDAAVESLAAARLPPEELAVAAEMKGRRRRSFHAGRLAVREAALRAGLACGAVLVGPRGAPAWPAGIAGSVSHKETVAAALLARDEGATLGVDVELDVPRRAGIAGHVLTDEELAEHEALPEADRPRALLVRFSIKESIYKALDPYVQRYIGFKEVRVWPAADGTARVEAALRDGAFAVDAAWRAGDGFILTAVHARRTTAR